MNKDKHREQILQEALNFIEIMRCDSKREIEKLKEKLAKVGALGYKKIFPK